MTFIANGVMKHAVVAPLILLIGCATTPAQPSRTDADRKTEFGQCRPEVAALPARNAAPELECDIRGVNQLTLPR